MGIVTTIECDGCGKRKGPDNHWWLLSLDPNVTGLCLRHLREMPDPGILTLCGEECVIKSISAYLGGEQWPPAKKRG